MKRCTDTYSTDAYSRLLSCIRLARTPNIGPVTFLKLMKLYKCPEVIVDALCSGECRSVKNVFSLDDAEREIELSTKIGAEIISICDEEYPPMLSRIYDPPIVITVLGDKNLLSNEQKVAIVGSRNASANGKRIAYNLAYDLSRAGFTTVSGLARGIDSAVHSVTFRHIPTIAVIASGVDIIYPIENSGLYKAIAQNGGLIVTELPLSSLPKANLFPQRNRIISGLSLGVVVVEASMKSGSLITANLAMSQSREVFAVPGSPLDQRCLGSNNLIRQGAFLVESVEDIIDALGFSSCSAEIKNTKRTGEFCLSSDNDHPGGTFEAKASILRHLSNSPTSIDDIMVCSGMSIDELLSSIAELELLGAVERLPQNMLTLAKKKA